MRCTGMSDSDLFEMHKIHMLNMLKYTESIKEMLSCKIKCDKG